METADLVLEGGGVKGAGLAGGVGVLARRYEFGRVAGGVGGGAVPPRLYEFGRVAGTSAGAIVASFIAAGLTEKLEQIMVETDFAAFLDRGGVLGHLGKLGQGLDVLFHEGIYRGERLHRWIEETLIRAPKPVRTW